MNSGKNSRKIVLVVPREEKPVIFYFAPLAPLSISKRLLEAGYEPVVVDAKLEKDKFLDRVVAETRDALLLWASGKIGRQLVDLIEAGRAAKKARPDLPVAFGGWHASLETPSTIATDFVDFVVRRQAQDAAVELADALSSGGDLTKIAGLTYKADGRVVNNPDRPWDKNLDRFLPLPYDLVDIERYIERDGGLGQRMIFGVDRCINYTSSRGCHGRCGFCHITALYERGWMGASAARVLDDLELLAHRYRIEGIDFHDSNFFTNLSRAKKILNGLVERNIDIKWRASVRIDQMLRYPDDLMELIARSGAVELAIGGESGSQRIMDLIGKEITPEDVKECSRRCLSFGMAPLYSIMVGFPDEKNWEDTKRTISFMADLKGIAPDADMSYFYYVPFPGTPMFEYAVREGNLKAPATLDGWTIYSPYDPTMPWVDRKLVRLLHMSFSFYFRFAMPDEGMREMMRSHRLAWLIRLMHRISLYRVRRRRWEFPVEYRTALFVKDVLIKRLGLFKGLRKIV